MAAIMISVGDINFENLSCNNRGVHIVSYSNEKTKGAEIHKIKVLLITQFLK